MKEIGLPLGQPSGVVASVVLPETNLVRVQQLQEGSVGKDYVFKIAWPNTPTRGSWVIAANGRAPVILDWNVSAANLENGDRVLWIAGCLRHSFGKLFNWLQP